MVVVKRSVRKVGRSDHRSAVSKYVQLGVKVAHAANAGTSFEQLAQSSDIAGNSGKVDKVEPGDDLNSRGVKRQKVLDSPCFDERADDEKLATVDNERFGELVAPSSVNQSDGHTNTLHIQRDSPADTTANHSHMYLDT